MARVQASLRKRGYQEDWKAQEDTVILNYDGGMMQKKSLRNVAQKKRWFTRKAGEDLLSCSRSCCRSNIVNFKISVFGNSEATT